MSPIDANDPGSAAPGRASRRLELADATPQCVYTFGYRLFAGGGVAEDETAWTWTGDAIRPDCVDAHPCAQGRLDNCGLVEVRRQPGDQVQAGGDAGRLEPGQPPRQCRQQRVAPPAVNRAHAPQVAVELSAGDE